MLNWTAFDGPIHRCLHFTGLHLARPHKAACNSYCLVNEVCTHTHEPNELHAV